MWADSHCHLSSTGVGSDVIDPARAAGVTRLVAIGTNAAESAAAIDVARAHPGVWATVGLHPHDAVEGVEGIATLLDPPDPVVVGVGECGLDYHYDYSPRAVQREAFAAQIALAAELDLTLVVHTRQAWDDTFDILTATGVPERWILHCFTWGSGRGRAGIGVGGDAVVQRNCDVQVRVRCAGRRSGLSPRPVARRDGQPVFGSRSSSRSGQQSGPGAHRRGRRGGRPGGGAGRSRAGHLGQHRRRVPTARPTGGPTGGPTAGPTGGSRRVTLSPRQISDLLTTHGLRPSRALGQNFVTDANTVRRIVRLAGVGPGDRVLEIGPGLGSLTLALEEAGAAITAVEVDRRLLPVLEAVLGPANVRVLHGDAMKMNWADVLGTEPGWVMVANLPYNIASPLVADLLDGVPTIERMVIMVQREVGERLAALPGNPQYGAISVKVAYWAEASVVGHVPPAVFLPRPKVDSALVSIRRRPVPAIDTAKVDRRRPLPPGPGRLRQAPQDVAAGAGGDGSGRCLRGGCGSSGQPGGEP